MATLSILGLYNYDPSIFDSFQLPAQMDREMVFGNLLAELAELEVLYPSNTVMKSVIGFWSSKMLEKWEKLYATTKLDYNPIENYDRVEEFTDAENRTTESSGNSTGHGTGTSINFVSGYNSAEMTPSDRGTSEDDTRADSAAESKEDRVLSRNGRVHGNIGVTTTQQMIAAERESVSFVVTDVIIKDFADRFCIGVW